jgi:hypothetical protein
MPHSFTSIGKTLDMHKIQKLLLAVFFPGAIFAQEPFGTTAISIFKDGNSFVIKKGKVQPKNNVFTIYDAQIPQALFGTFWVNTPAGTISSVKSYTDTLEQQSKAGVRSIADLVMANKGKDAILYTTEVYEGRIEDVLVSEQSGAVYSAELGGVRMVVGHTPHLVFVKLKNGQSVALPVAEIKRLHVAGDFNTSFPVTYREQHNLLDIEFGSNAGQDLELMYLQKGLSWVPFYNLELGEGGKAKLTLRSELINNAESFTNANLSFVVGASNFRYATSLTGLVNFLNTQAQYLTQRAAVPYTPVNVFSNSMRTTNNDFLAESSSRAAPSQPDPENSFANDLTGEQSDDLYFYTLKNASLKKGARAHYQLFETPVDYETIYKCDLGANGENNHNYENTFDFRPDLVNSVRHTIKLSNASSNPFTTAPVLLTRRTGDKLLPIGQDIIYYTPIKGKVSVDVNTTSDIVVNQAEKESSRTPNERRWNSYYVDKVLIEGKIKLQNYKKEDAKMVVGRIVYGNLIQSDLPWKNTEQRQNPNVLNKSNKVLWETTVKAGQTKEISYSYHYYIYHN